MDEKFWRKNGKKKLFWSVLGWVGRKKNKWWGLGVASFFIFFFQFFLFSFDFLSLGVPFFLAVTLPFFSFDFLEPRHDSCCCLFIYLTRHDFYAFNKFGWLLFFCGYLSLFCFNWASFFNNGIWVNFCKLTFPILSLFHS